ncbi:MAG: flagellar filament capping protein FliD [Lachnospiraceae bacterium]|nr:flagellar filament capping protein FliD [Lachnospiraceae bacterium]
MSSPIRMTGMTSGLDTESIVTALTSGYKSKVDKYKQQQTKISWKQDAWKNINKKVYSLYTSLDSMRFSANWKLQKASSSDTTKATVTSNGKAFTGTQTLRIASIATAASMTGGKLADNISGSSTLADLGYTDGSSATITVNGKSFAVDSTTTVDGFVNSLQSNGLNANFDSASHRIFVAAKKSGAANDFSIEGDSNGVKVLQSLGLLSGSKSTKAYDTYSSLLGSDISYSDQAGLALTSGTTTDSAVLEALKKNIDAMADKYNTAVTKSGMYSTDISKISDDLAYVSTFRSYNEDLAKYASGTGLDTLDSAVSDLSKMGSDSLFVGNTEYKLTDSANGIYSADGGTTNYKKNDNGDLVEVEKDSDGSWKETNDSSKTIAKDTIKTFKDKLASSSAYDTIAKALYPSTAGDKLSDDQKKAITEALSSLVSSKRSIDKFESTDVTTSTTPDSASGYDSAQAVQSRQDVIALVKGSSSSYKASSYSADDVTAAITKLNQASAYWKKEKAAADQTVSDSSLVASFAAKKTSDAAAYESAVAELAQTARTAFNNQYETNKAIDSSQSGSLSIKKNGTDAKIYLNGQEYRQDSNNFTVNGLTITVSGVTANAESGGKENEDGDSISISNQVDTQGIYDKIKNFFSVYNDAINELTDAFNAESSKGYDPLTEDQKSEMSDTQVEKWEKKAKAGLLRNDSTLNSIMTSITNSMLGSFTIDGKKVSLSTFGIKTKGILNAATNRQYEYHIDGDEDDESSSSNADKLMAAINEDPDSVISFMQQLTNKLYTNLDKKMKRTSLKTAYTVYNDKEMASEYSSYNKLIKEWEDRLSTLEDSYYKKFSKMETTLQQLQSSTSSLTSSLSS